METHRSDWFIAWAHAAPFLCDSAVHSAMSKLAATVALLSAIRLRVSVLSAAIALGEWVLEYLALTMKNQGCRLDVM
jgi:hypothetical protein